MTQSIQPFRKQIIDAVMENKSRLTGAQMHLLYTPELADPLELIGNAKRDTAIIRPPSGMQASAPAKDNQPRLITLDCRRSAPYMLETDPALDDPLFESSITQAHAEVHLQQKQDAELNNAEQHFSDTAIGGWILGTENASTIATRFQSYAALRLANQQRDWVRWTNPIYISALWPTMSIGQKRELLGDAIWLAFDAVGQLRRYAAEENAGSAQEQGMKSTEYAFHRLNVDQTHTLQNIPIVRDLLPGWQAMCEADGHRLPANAEQQLHTHVLAAQQAGLDPESVAIYTMTAVQLKNGATQNPEWKKLIRHAASNGLLLRDLLDKLSDDFWDRNSLYDYEDDQ